MKQRHVYDCNYIFNEYKHPQIRITETFPDACSFEPLPIYDAWCFWAEPIDNMPEWFEISSNQGPLLGFYPPNE